MNELSALLTLELRSLYGINKFRHTKDKKEKSRYRLTLAAMVILVLTLFSYVGGLVYGLWALGLGAIVPAYLAAISSLIILAFGIFTAGNRIFGAKGYDILSSMPVKTENIVLSRFLSLYAEDLVLTLAVMLPGVAVYGSLARPGLGFYLVAVFGIVFIPAIPLVISTLLGTAVTALSARMKHKNLMQSLLSVAFVVAVLLGSFSTGDEAENLTPEVLAQLAQTMGTLLKQLYPPAVWLGRAMIGGELWGLGLFVMVSVAVMALSIYIVSKMFHSTVGKLMNVAARQDYKLSALERRGLLKALYIREVKRYFSSSIYVTNTIIGPIMGLIMAVALAFSGLEAVQSAIPVDITGLIPFAFAGVFSMMTTTSTSISLEGKHFWAIQSLPIPTKALLDGKILLNLSLMTPFYVLGEIALVIALKPDFLAFLWLLLIPLTIMLFSVVLGITVNLKFHSFDWEREETVVKQSLPAALGGFAGFFLAAVLGVLRFVIPAAFSQLVLAVMCLLILGITSIFYRKNNRAVLAKL